MIGRAESTTINLSILKGWISAAWVIALMAPLYAVSAPAPLWSPGTPCTGGCNIEIMDHSGVVRTSPSSAVFKVNSPRVATSSGPRTVPFLDLYNPKLKMIQECAKKVRSIKKPAPGAVRLRAREFTLAGSSKVVFLVEKCGRGGPGGPGHKPGMGPGPHDGPGPGPGPGPGGDGAACASGDMPASTSCTETGGGWQNVSNVLSEASCQLGYTDAVAGPGRMVIYDNSYSVTCNGSSHEPSVRVGMTPADSNWGAFNAPSESCRMKTGVRPSDGTRVVEKILCPSTPR